jgi:hypothetical protein
MYLEEWVKNIDHLGVELLLSFTCFVLHLFIVGRKSIIFIFAIFEISDFMLSKWISFLVYLNLFEIKDFMFKILFVFS